MLQPYTDPSTALGGSGAGLTGLTPTPTPQPQSQPMGHNSSAGTNQGQSTGGNYGIGDDGLFRHSEAGNTKGGGGMGWW